jgi:hypothetical protein
MTVLALLLLQLILITISQMRHTCQVRCGCPDAVLGQVPLGEAAAVLLLSTNGQMDAFPAAHTCTVFIDGAETNAA